MSNYTRNNPLLLLTGSISSVSIEEYYPVDDGSGLGPSSVNNIPVRFTLTTSVNTQNVGTQLAGSSSSKYDGLDIKQGMWVANQAGTICLKVLKVLTKSASSVTVLVEDVDAFSYKNNQENTFINGQSCAFFNLSDSGMPQISGEDAISHFNSAVPILKLQARFSIQQNLDRFRLEFSSSQSIEVGQVVVLNNAKNALVPYGTANADTFKIGIVLELANDDKVVFLKPFNKVVDNFVKPELLTGSAGDTYYTTSNGQMTTDSTLGGSEIFYQLTNSIPTVVEADTLNVSMSSSDTLSINGVSCLNGPATIDQIVSAIEDPTKKDLHFVTATKPLGVTELKSFGSSPTLGDVFVLVSTDGGSTFTYPTITLSDGVNSANITLQSSSTVQYPGASNWLTLTATEIAAIINVYYASGQLDISASTFSHNSGGQSSTYPGLTLTLDTSGSATEIAITNGTSDAFGTPVTNSLGFSSSSIQKVTDERLTLTRADGGDILLTGLGTFVNSNGIVSSSSGSPAILLVADSKGPQGLQGPKGDTGDTGLQGPQGATGATGPQGPAGSQGVQGIEGPQGPQGVQGATGPQGATGLQGPAGNDGAQGLQGVKGDTGDTGPQGPQGIQGIQGATGTGITFKGSVSTDPSGSGDVTPLAPNNTTFTPAQGDALLSQNGDKLFIFGGSDWVDGGSIQGPQGIQGIQGVKGDTGDTGAQGLQGPTGPSGSSVTISSVTNNSDNTITISFSDGTNHTTDSLKGDTGATGLQGIQGEAGADGQDGADADNSVISGNLSTNSTFVSSVASNSTLSSNVSTSLSQNSTFQAAVKGDTGAQGPQGETGQKGDTGDTGAQGATGPQGPAGTDADSYIDDTTYATNKLWSSNKINSELSSKANTSAIPTATSDLTNDSGFITGYTVTQSDVTAHEDALTITKSQISDFNNSDYQPADSNIVSDANYVATEENYTTAEKSKLDGIEAGAKDDQTAQEIATLIDADSTAEATLKSALGLGTAAYTESTAYATAAQGAKADSALQAHPSISAASSSSNSGRTYIQSIGLDSNGHVTSISTATEDVVNTNTTYSAASGGGLSVSDEEFSIDNSVTAATLNDAAKTVNLSFNAKGLITSASLQDIEIEQSQVTGLASSLSAKQDNLSFGTSNTNVIKADSSTIASGEYAKFTSSGLESKSFAEVKTDLNLPLNTSTSISSIEADIGTATLSTSATDLKSAINELKTNNSSTQADLDTLETKVGTADLDTSADNVVAAVNEVHTELNTNTTNIANLDNLIKSNSSTTTTIDYAYNHKLRDGYGIVFNMGELDSGLSEVSSRINTLVGNSTYNQSGTNYVDIGTVSNLLAADKALDAEIGKLAIRDGGLLLETTDKGIHMPETITLSSHTGPFRVDFQQAIANNGEADLIFYGTKSKSHEDKFFTIDTTTGDASFTG